MKFFEFIPLSSSLKEYSVYLDDAPNIPVPFRPLYSQYSILQSRLPKSVSPNSASLLLEILVATFSMFALLVFLPNHLYSKRVNTQRACARDLYLPLLSIFSHSLNCISELPNPCNESVDPPSKHDNDILSPIRYAHLTYLLYVSSFDNHPYSKSKKILETKVAAMKLRGFNHS